MKKAPLVRRLSAVCCLSRLPFGSVLAAAPKSSNAKLHRENTTEDPYLLQAHLCIIGSLITENARPQTLARGSTCAEKVGPDRLSFFSSQASSGLFAIHDPTTFSFHSPPIWPTRVVHIPLYFRWILRFQFI